MKKKTVKLTVAEQLREAVRANGSIAATARGAGIAQPVLHRFMAGERDLTLRTVEKLLRYFNLEVRPRLYGETEGQLVPILKEIIRECRKDRVEISLNGLSARASKIQQLLEGWDGKRGVVISEQP